MHCLSHCSMSYNRMNFYRTTNKKKEESLASMSFFPFLFFFPFSLSFISICSLSLSLSFLLSQKAFQYSQRSVQQSVRRNMTFVPFSVMYSALNTAEYALKVYQRDNKIEKGKASAFTHRNIRKQRGYIDNDEEFIDTRQI